ncbi:thioesterase [Natronosporangium hydrolyticum]|uniref:Thioesterase n=1 Tax=Natronosporangium hydrolyticum TaxID=2811111 RepID=A0A895YIN3_9ACTN|nr:thioesterase domain-containing protein [Natronosporangium hydrolyticum]QSB13980.1 thioesterase [Natronosporangium hydrolyticum]
MTVGDTPPLRLYCFPHAGATAAGYRSWAAADPPGIEVRGLDPPGRGVRAREPRPADFAGLVAALAGVIVDELRASGPATPYATFGHSFGTLVSLAVAAQVTRDTGRPPRCVVLSAGLPPRWHSPVDEAAGEPDELVLTRIAEVGGTPPELLAQPALAQHVIGRFRADYAIRAEFHRHTDLRVDFPLTLVAAADDRHAPPARMWDWQRHTTAASRTVTIPGGHFAALGDPARIFQLVRDEALAGVAGAARKEAGDAG